MHEQPAPARHSPGANQRQRETALSRHADGGRNLPRSGAEGGAEVKGRGFRRGKMVAPAALRVVRCGGGGRLCSARPVFSADAK